MLYRGIKLTSEEINDYIPFLGNPNGINMKGINSTSLDQKRAIHFAMKKLQSPKIPVLMVIQFYNSAYIGSHHFVMDNDKYSVFPKEKEVVF